MDAGVIDTAFTSMGIASTTGTPTEKVNIDDIVARIKNLAPADQQIVIAALQR